MILTIIIFVLLYYTLHCHITLQDRSCNVENRFASSSLCSAIYIFHHRRFTQFHDIYVPICSYVDRHNYYQMFSIPGLIAVIVHTGKDRSLLRTHFITVSPKLSLHFFREALVIQILVSPHKLIIIHSIRYPLRHDLTRALVNPSVL